MNTKVMGLLVACVLVMAEGSLESGDVRSSAGEAMADFHASEHPKEQGPVETVRDSYKEPIGIYPLLRSSGREILEYSDKVENDAMSDDQLDGEAQKNGPSTAHDSKGVDGKKETGAAPGNAEGTANKEEQEHQAEFGDKEKKPVGVSVSSSSPNGEMNDNSTIGMKKLKVVERSMHSGSGHVTHQHIHVPGAAVPDQHLYYTSLPTHITSLFGPDENDTFSTFPTNVTGFYRGPWKFVNADSESPLRVAASRNQHGHFGLPLEAKPSSIPGVDVVEGTMTVREAYFAPDNREMEVHGVYSRHTGIVELVAVPKGVKIPIWENMSNSTKLSDIMSVVWNPHEAYTNVTVAPVHPSRRYRRSATPPCFFKLAFKMLPISEHRGSNALKKKMEAAEKEDTGDIEEEYNTSRHFVKMRGVIWSPNCNIVASANASAIKESFFPKAINYTLMVSFVSFLQVVLLIRQMDFTSTQAGASKVALLSIGMQAIMDSYLSLLHLTVGISVEPLFNSFATAAFFKFVIFSTFEMRYLMVIYKARRPQAVDVSVRRELSTLYFALYGSLFFGILLILKAPQLIQWVIVLMYSFWVPQIITNATKDTRKAMDLRYVIGISITRLCIPLYFYACPYNFIHQTPQYTQALRLAGWMVVQVSILLLQSYLGPRFFVPKRFLPGTITPSVKYNYFRPIVRVTDEEDPVECVICMMPVDMRPSLRMITPCDHIFHPDCLEKWMDIKLECPTCRAPLPPV